MNKIQQYQKGLFSDKANNIQNTSTYLLVRKTKRRVMFYSRLDHINHLCKGKREGNHGDESLLEKQEEII